MKAGGDILKEKTILIVDDEPEINELLETYLLAESFGVLKAGNGKDAIKLAKEYKPDLIILDVMMPQFDGMEVCRILRAVTQVPIIFLSAKSDEFSKVIGLELGGDDYVTKPFSPRELLARIKANLRRPAVQEADLSQIPVSHSHTQSSNSGNNLLIFPGLKIDLEGYRVWVNEKQIKLSAKEFELLKFLACNPNKVFSKEKLYDQIWSADSFGDSRTVMVHMSRLREKLEQDASLPTYLKTIWGIGYSFELPDASTSIIS
jgi:DNA-binding response OmpR family regulator